MKNIVLVFIAMALPSFAIASDIEIISLNTAGEISWLDTNTNGTYSVQWVPAVTNTNWRSDWGGLTQIAATGGVITAKIPMFFRITYRPRSTNEMLLVSGGGQPQGPAYDFYMSKYEVRNDEYAQFLNDAHINTGNARGAYMYFADNGKVYFTSNFNSSTLFFDPSSSRILYNPEAAVGTRYTVHPQYIGHPVVGVSWYGCVKYCNWLTIFSGKGEAQRCYSEGTNTTAWKPVHISSAQWTDGFDYFERLSWVQNYTGFRLPQWEYTTTASDFEEWYKAAAWTGASNVLYGFGRGNITGPDANYSGSGDPFEASPIGTTPVGYYNGSLQGGSYQTASNGNYYGIYDLTGNVDEWMNDNAVGSVPSCRGGGWASSLKPNNTHGGSLQRYGVNNYTGFRVVTTMP